MSALPSCVFLTMPTSGTGSLWRLITAIAGGFYEPSKITEFLENNGRGAEITTWVPEPVGHVYMYNTPHFVNPNLANPAVRLITNFRDPRDLSCNQYHWAFQHPMPGHSEESIAKFRASVGEAGIDAFVVSRDNNILFKSLRALAARVQNGDPNVLNISYNQLCLDFDNLLDRLIDFLAVPRESVKWDVLERERTSNLKDNPHWIGQIWSGTDIMPGRYRQELRKDTIAVLDKKYYDSLKFVRALELPHLRYLLNTEGERQERERVLVGRDDELFLQNDASNTVAQITGKTKLSWGQLSNIGLAHRGRQLLGETVMKFQYGHAIIPSKEVLHSAKLPAEIVFEEHGSRPLQQYFDADLTGLWRPFYQPDLLEPQAGSRFYPVTDSHWNHQGAFRYLAAFLSVFSPALASRMAAIELRSFTSRQQGDLGGKLDIGPETVEIIVPAASSAKAVFENGVANEGCVRWYRNAKAAGGPRAFILHDSFTMWLFGILSELFSEVVFFHGTIFDSEFVQKLAPDIVICLQAERFFTRVPETGGDMLKYVADEEKQKNAAVHLADFLHAVGD